MAEVRPLPAHPEPAPRAARVGDAGEAGEAGEADEGVSDVLGAILLVGLTVAMTVVLAILLFTYNGPEPVPRADLAVTVLPGERGWGTGDENVTVRHVGGMALSDATRIAIRVGANLTEMTGPTLGDPFGDGALSIGESWSKRMTIRANDLVTINVVGDNGSAGTLLASVTIVPAGVAP